MNLDNEQEIRQGYVQELLTHKVVLISFNSPVKAIINLSSTLNWKFETFER